MRQLWVRWTLLVLFVAVLGTAFVNLGAWQLDRLHQRRERNATTLTNERAPVRPYADVFTRTITVADQWQRVQAQGTFDAAHQFVVRYRNNGDASGYEIVTPLHTSSGTVLVDRGFIPLAQGVQIPTSAPDPPPGEVTIVGYVHSDEAGRRGAVTPSGDQVRLVNSAALAPTLPYPIVNGFISAVTLDPPQSGGFQPVALPEISEGPHFWYAVQWFMFAGIGVAGIVVFIRGDLRVRREELAKAAEEAQRPSSPSMDEEHAI